MLAIALLPARDLTAALRRYLVRTVGPKLHSDPTDNSTALTVSAVAVILVGGHGVSTRRQASTVGWMSGADAEWGF